MRQSPHQKPGFLPVQLPAPRQAAPHAGMLRPSPPLLHPRPPALSKSAPGSSTGMQATARPHLHPPVLSSAMRPLRGSHPPRLSPHAPHAGAGMPIVQTASKAQSFSKPPFCRLLHSSAFRASAHTIMQQNGTGFIPFGRIRWISCDFPTVCMHIAYFGKAKTAAAVLLVVLVVVLVLLTLPIATPR